MSNEDTNIELADLLGAESEGSTQSLTLIIPSADINGKDIENQEVWVKEAASLLAHIGGGVTIMPPVEGGWLSPEGNIIWEKPIFVYTYIKPDLFLEKLGELRNFLHRMGRETNQGEIACQFDGTLYRITVYDPAERNI